jgi:hypothetical protein
MKKSLLLIATLVFQLAGFAQSSQLLNGYSAETVKEMLGPAPQHQPSAAMERTGDGVQWLQSYNSRMFGCNINGGSMPISPYSSHLNTPMAYASYNNPLGTVLAYDGTWANGKWYCVFSDNSFATFDTTTGAKTIIGTMTPVSGDTWTGLSYDIVGGIMYATSASTTGSNLYSVNPATAAVTFIGTETGDLLITLAADNAGQLYSVEILADNFGSVNKTTGAFTIIGPIGFNANYAQDMEFDHSTDTCFYACYNLTSGRAEMRTVNVATGATTLIGAFPDTAEIAGLAIPYSGSTGIPSYEKSNVTLGSYPNPFNQQTDITFSIPQSGKVLLEIADVYGRIVSTLVDEDITEGNHKVTVNSSDYSAGIYLCQLRTLAGTVTNKLVVVK